MAVYINASGHLSAKNCQKRTACQLGQTVELPYFSAFEQPLLNLEQLLDLLVEQVYACVQKAGWQKAELPQIPLLLGSTAYTISDCEYRFQHQQPQMAEPSLLVIAEQLSQRLGSTVWNFATSCTSSAQAVGYATKMIAQGKANKAIVLGFEMFNCLTFEHFHAMGLLATEAQGRGIILGEGIGCLALSSSPSACEIVGVASVTDNESLTNNSRQSLEKLISQILTKSGCSASEVQAIKPHFVGSEFDAQEKALLENLFKNRPLVLPKKQCGHTLGASGALETSWLIEELARKIRKFDRIPTAVA